MKTCMSCGMPMLAEEDFCGSDPASDLCVNCGQGPSTRGRLVSFAILESKPGKADELLEVMRENLSQTRGLDGVTDAFISQSPLNPNQFFTLSRWRDRAAYDAVQEVTGTRENPAITEDISELLAGDPLFGLYDVMD